MACRSMGNSASLPDVFSGQLPMSLAGRADKGCTTAFFVAHILVPHQRTLQSAQADQPLEDVFGGFQMREPAELFKVCFIFAPGYFLNLIKGLPVDQRLVGIFNDDPLPPLASCTAPGFRRRTAASFPCTMCPMYTCRDRRFLTV